MSEYNFFFSEHKNVMEIRSALFSFDLDHPNKFYEINEYTFVT